MTRDDILGELRTTRAEFDALLSRIPIERLAEPAPGRFNPLKDVVWHVAAYDQLVVERLRAAHNGETTAFDRDRVGWEAFNERIWAEAAELDAPTILDHAEKVFRDLLEEVGQLTDDELAGKGDLVTHIDPGWLREHTLVEAIGVDCFEHYPMHFDDLRAAAADAGMRPEA